MLAAELDKNLMVRSQFGTQRGGMLVQHIRQFPGAKLIILKT